MNMNRVEKKKRRRRESSKGKTDGATKTGLLGITKVPPAQPSGASDI